MENSQSVLLKSIPNARELGGYITADGKSVKRGLLLRSAKLNDISEEDKSALINNFHVQDIIDFRMKMEIAGFEDAEFDGARYHWLDVIEMPDLDKYDGEMPDIKPRDVIQAVELIEMSGMLQDDMYVGFLEGEKGKKAYGGFLRILLESDPERAVLWHCTGGKDRTGLASMLILSALGADKKTIMSDYLLTNKFNEKRIAGVKHALSKQGFDETFVNKAALAFEAVDERFMRTALEHLKNNYGSAVGYIKDGLKISDGEIAVLKEKYLTD